MELFFLTISCCRPTDTEARIVKIRSNGFIVFVPKYDLQSYAGLLLLFNFLVSMGKKREKKIVFIYGAVQLLLSAEN